MGTLASVISENVKQVLEKESIPLFDSMSPKELFLPYAVVSVTEHRKKEPHFNLTHFKTLIAIYDEKPSVEFAKNICEKILTNFRNLPSKQFNIPKTGLPTFDRFSTHINVNGFSFPLMLIYFDIIPIQHDPIL